MGALLRSRPAMGSERIDAWTRERRRRGGADRRGAGKGGGEEGQKNNNNTINLNLIIIVTFVKVNLISLSLSSRLHFLRAVSACGGEAGRTIGGEDT